MYRYSVSREGEAAMFTYSSIEKQQRLMDFLLRNEIQIRFEGGKLVMEVPFDHVENFLYEFMAYKIEKL